MLNIYLPVHPSLRSILFLSVAPTQWMSIHPFTHSHLHLFICLLNCPFIYPYVYLSVYLWVSVYSLNHLILSVHAPIYPSTYSLIHPFT